MDDPEAGAPLVVLPLGVEGFAAGGVEPVVDGAVVLAVPDDEGVCAV